MDESGNTGDLVRTGPDLDFGGQPVFSLAAVGLVNEDALAAQLADLRKKHNVQASELKLSKILKRKPQFALDAVRLLVENDLPLFVEIVDKKYQLAIGVTNGFIWPPYFNAEESQKTVWMKNIFADYIYHRIPKPLLFEFVGCMLNPSNEKTESYFEALKECVGRDYHEISQSIASQIEESQDDFHIMIQQEGEAAHRRFLPLPDIGKRGQEVWVLPNFSSFTNMYARMNLFLQGALKGVRLFHDEQAHFDEIIAVAKQKAEGVEVDPEKFKLLNSDYNFRQVAELFFKASPECTGIQLADIVAGIFMRCYQAHLHGEDDRGVLDSAAHALLHHGASGRGTGVNIVGPDDMVHKIFSIRG